MSTNNMNYDATIQKLIDSHDNAAEIDDWSFFVSDLYAADCVYTCEYAGVMTVVANGVDEIMQTHYGRDMAGWEGWTFPYTGVYKSGDNKFVTHWMNRGPGLRANGMFYETNGISFIEVNPEGKISMQYDMFDLGHQMKLCDELDHAGLLSPKLKEIWVEPMRAKLIAQLTQK